ncbi:MAG TPA: HNH endonuclease signature motif containing protein, partial [Methanosarcina sp.]|nr:HNH endonuclease signature motif containing protein [Methanosarcina sp.]
MIDRFLSKISVESTGCFKYLGAKDKDGYGYFKLNGKTYKAHRIAIQLHTGVDPKGHLVLHHCDNPSCVNPDHLYLGTPKQNMQDRKDRNRNAGWSGYKAEGHLNNNSKLTEENVI